MDASTIAEGIFLGVLFVVLGYYALQIVIGICMGIYQGINEAIVRFKVEQMFKEDK